MKYKDGEPCSHIGCLNHVTHPCEGCGRVAGMDYRKRDLISLQKEIEKGVSFGVVDIQRAMRWGYNRAYRTLELAQEEGVVAEVKCDHSIRHKFI